jgi:outer membrane receptor protein involved in Fe transport
LSEDARAGLDFYQWGIQVPAKPFPLSWDQRHTVKVIGALQLPLQFGFSWTWEFHTGRPYTYYPSSDGFTPDDPNQEFEPNNARIEDYNLLNMKLNKDFAIGSGVRPWMVVSVYLDGRNVLNTKNVLWVDSSGRVGGELGDLTAYGPGRRIRLGLKVVL